MNDLSEHFSPYNLAERWKGVSEKKGRLSNDDIVAMLRLDNDWPKVDEVPWCAAFVNMIAYAWRAKRSKVLMARSYLRVGQKISEDKLCVGHDIVVIKRGRGGQPGPEVLDAPGHVGFFAGFKGKSVLILGGNQSDSVNITAYPKSRVLGYRRL